jgi:hypothetical protein
MGAIEQLNRSRGTPYYLRKFIAIFLSASLSLSESALYAQTSAVSLLLDPHKKWIPAEFGMVDESRVIPGAKTILYVQDAHDSLEAQENIARMIAYAVKRYGVRTVFDEGSEGKIETTGHFRFIPESALRKKIAHWLLDHLEISAAEYARLISKKDFELVGADDAELHEQNIGFYRQALESRGQIENQIDEIEAEVHKLTRRRFPKIVNEWIKRRIAWKLVY